VAVRLQADGFDVLTARDAGMLGAADEEHLAFATSQGRAVLTHNIKHYARLAISWAALNRKHAGILLCKQLPASDVYRSAAQALLRYPEMHDLTLHLPLAD
jgi:hypothetical protein